MINQSRVQDADYCRAGVFLLRNTMLLIRGANLSIFASRRPGLLTRRFTASHFVEPVAAQKSRWYMIVFSLLTKYMTYEVVIGQLVMFAPSVCSIGVLRLLYLQKRR